MWLASLAARSPMIGNRKLTIFGLVEKFALPRPCALTMACQGANYISPFCKGTHRRGVIPQLLDDTDLCPSNTSTLELPFEQEHHARGDDAVAGTETGTAGRHAQPNDEYRFWQRVKPAAGQEDTGPRVLRDSWSRRAELVRQPRPQGVGCPKLPLLLAELRALTPKRFRADTVTPAQTSQPVMLLPGFGAHPLRPSPPPATVRTNGALASISAPRRKTSRTCSNASARSPAPKANPSPSSAGASGDCSPAKSPSGATMLSAG